MKYFLFIFITTLNLFSLDFKVASYNVENFFDLQYNKTEYKEYIPHTKYWNKKSYETKLTNISKVIKNLNADILALQEVESQLVLDAIIKKNPSYKYTAFRRNKNSAIGLGIISKFPITNNKSIPIDKFDKYARDILKITLNIENKPFIIYINHWRSKRAKESQRIKYALALQNDIETLDEKSDYIIIGDLNSNYNEYQTFKYNKRLNDTFNLTGINQILNTTINENFVKKENIFKFTTKVHFNTWLELSKNNRFSTKYQKENNTPDNIILAKGLFDKQNISYINNSFGVFKPNYLYYKDKIFRWNKFKNKGYSDHLPIYAYFSTNIQDYNFEKITKHLKEKNSIKHLYDVQQVSQYNLKDVLVIYKTKNIAIIKQLKNDKSIMIYKPSDRLKLGFIHDIQVNKIDSYFGLKEIKSISNIILKKRYDKYKQFYLDGSIIDVMNEKYLNTVVYNIEGTYSKNYLYTQNKKIKLYFAKGIKKPEEKSKLYISSGHVSVYKSTMQIVLHREKDFIN